MRPWAPVVPSRADADAFSTVAEEIAVESLESAGRVYRQRHRRRATLEAKRPGRPFVGGVGGYRWSTQVAVGPRGLVGQGEGGGSDRTVGSGPGLCLTPHHQAVWSPAPTLHRLSSPQWPLPRATGPYALVQYPGSAN